MISATALLTLASEEGGHAADTHPGGLVGLLADGAWLIPIVPLVMMFAIVLFGKRLPFKGWELAEAAMAFVGVYGVALLIGNWVHPVAAEYHLEIARIGVIPGLGDLVIEWGWMVDGL